MSEQTVLIDDFTQKMLPPDSPDRQPYRLSLDNFGGAEYGTEVYTLHLSYKSREALQKALTPFIGLVEPELFKGPKYI